MEYKLKPAKYTIRVCHGEACKDNNAHLLARAIEKAVKVQLGKYSKDKDIALYECECLGHCEKGPNMSVNGRVYNELDRDRLNNILKNILRDIRHGQEETKEADF